MKFRLPTPGSSPFAIEAALLRAAAGDHGAEAGLALLTCCGDWLLRLDEAGLITVDICLAGCCNDPTAQINWAEVQAALSDGRLVGSASDVAVLRVAASLASGRPVNLRDLTASLERRVLAPIQTAIAFAT